MMQRLAMKAVAPRLKHDDVLALAAPGDEHALHRDFMEQVKLNQNLSKRREIAEDAAARARSSVNAAPLQIFLTSNL